MCKMLIWYAKNVLHDKLMDLPCKFCHQRSEFHWNHQGISGSMFCPNLEGKPGEYI